MPEYFATARNAQGKKVTERLDVSSADEAVQTLRERGYDEIVLHTDDLAARHTKQKAVASTVSARQYLWFRSMPPWLAHVLVVTIAAYRKGWYWNVGAIALLAYRLWQGRSWGLAETCLVIYIFFPIIFAFGSLLFRGASGRYRRLMEAVAWGKWDEVVRLADAAAGKLPAEELAFQKAKALAGLGRIDEGLKLVEPLADGKKMPLSTYWSRVAGLYTTAKRRDDSQAAMEKALACSPDNVTLMIDVAESEVWLRHNPKRARELLTKARTHAISDLLQPFVINTEGLIQLEDGRANARSSSNKLSRRPRCSGTLLRSWKRGSIECTFPLSWLARPRAISNRRSATGELPNPGSWP